MRRLILNRNPPLSGALSLLAIYSCRDKYHQSGFFRWITSRTMTSKNRGALIVIEGVDKTGKSTQSKMLVDALLAQGKQAELVKFPGTLIDQ